MVTEYPAESIRAAWTGGKDSTVVLFLLKSVLDHFGRGPVRAINLDTGCKFPEVLAFRDRLAEEWEVELHVARPEVSLEGYPLAQDVVSCCRDLKITPLKNAIVQTGTRVLLTGIRGDEHPDRAGRELLEPRANPDHLVVNPVLDWTEADIWAAHTLFGIDHCELYDRGYRSLGCMPCTRKNAGNDERSGRHAKKENNMALLTSLGYF